MPTRRLLLLATLAALPWPALAEDKLKVVTTFTVIADMARNVAGEGVEVVSITKPGAEIHGYEPTPQDIVGASDAERSATSPATLACRNCTSGRSTPISRARRARSGR